MNPRFTNALDTSVTRTRHLGSLQCELIVVKQSSATQVSVDKSYVTKLHAKERSARYEDPSELINEQLAMGGPDLFSP